jgi:hypothetical protein
MTTRTSNRQRTEKHMLRGRKKRSLMDVVTCDGRVTPMFLFEEYSLLDEDLKNDIKRYCIEREWIPFIDYDPDFNSWVFHSITHGNMIWKKPIAKKYEALDEYRVGSEAKLEREFAAHLRNLGISVQTQVRCDCGIADVVTENRIYELKYRLDRASFFQALGQVLLYRQSINPNADVTLVCKVSIVPELHQFAKNMGVQVLVWRN